MSAGAQALLSRHRFDVDDYHQMARAGILTEEDRVELIDGEIVEMHAIGSRHFACVIRLTRLLIAGLGERAIVSVQGPVRLDRYSEPDPDVVVLHPRADTYAGGLPGPDETFLVIEVADTSLTYDRQVKLPLYARTGIPEVWIVDLTTGVVETHRDPSDDGYAHVTRVAEGHVAPAAFPDLELAVEDILPPEARDHA